MHLCQGKNKLGADCQRKAVIGADYCHVHNPDKPRKVTVTVTKGDESQEGAPELPARTNEEVLENSSPYFAVLNDVKRKITHLTDLKSLMEAERAVMNAIIVGFIDAKTAPSLAQMFKHQADLITKTTPKEQEFGTQAREKIIKLSAEMTEEQAWGLMQNFSQAMRTLSKPTPAIEAKPEVVDAQVVPIEVNDGKPDAESENTDCELF